MQDWLEFHLKVVKEDLNNDSLVVWFHSKDGLLSVKKQINELLDL